MNEHGEDRPFVPEPRYGSPNSPFLLAHEAAPYLRYSNLKSFYKAIVSERIPHRRRGRTLLFLPAELDRWLTENTEGRQAVDRHPKPALVRGRSR